MPTTDMIIEKLDTEGNIVAFQSLQNVVTSSTSVIGTLAVHGAAARVCFEVQNGTTSTTTGFDVQVQTYPGGTWVTYLDTADFDSTSNENMRWCTGVGPHELPVSTIAMASILVPPVHAMRWRAATTLASTASSLYLRGICSLI